MPEDETLAWIHEQLAQAPDLTDAAARRISTHLFGGTA
jgi:hypothetical protein